MKITIKRQFDLGGCGDEGLIIWVTEKVTPQELKKLIDNCETIKTNETAN